MHKKKHNELWVQVGTTKEGKKIFEPKIQKAYQILTPDNVRDYKEQIEKLRPHWRKVRKANRNEYK